jgi:hypothetical protein
MVPFFTSSCFCRAAACYVDSCSGPPFGDNVQFQDVANFSSYFILTPAKHRDAHVWLFKGSRLAIAATIDTMQPALGNLSSVPVSDSIAAGGSIVRAVQRVMAAADALFKPLLPPFAVREETAWVNDMLMDTRVLWEVSYESDSSSFYYNAHAGSAGWTTGERQAVVVGLLSRVVFGLGGVVVGSPSGLECLSRVVLSAAR